MNCKASNDIYGQNGNDRGGRLRLFLLLANVRVVRDQAGPPDGEMKRFPFPRAFLRWCISNCGQFAFPPRRLVLPLPLPLPLPQLGHQNSSSDTHQPAKEPP